MYSDIRNIGRITSKFSSIVKLFVKLVSLEKIAEKGSYYFFM